MITEPGIINIFKPKDMSSQNIVRTFKKKLPRKTKIGHFGTLDPFACGVLMLGVAGAQRLNEYIHECLPKTYIASGILGLETPSGDMTTEVTQKDDSDYIKTVIRDFSREFIEKTLKDKFLGEYWQAPHTYSAAKFEGKKLHEWARAGVEIKKAKKKRMISKVEVLSYDFPKLEIRFEVSSGTYIRSLFADCAKELGTLGTLEDLLREKVGGCTDQNAIKEKSWESELQFMKMDDVLDFSSLIFAPKEATLFSNGVKLKTDRVFSEKAGSLEYNYFWVRNEKGDILGLAKVENGEIHSLVNFSVSS